MPAAYLAGQWSVGGGTRKGAGGGGGQLPVLGTEIVDRAANGSLGIAKPWEMFCFGPLLPSEGDAKEGDPGKDCELHEESPRTKSRSRASARLRFLRTWSNPLSRVAGASELSNSSTQRLGVARPLPPSSTLSYVSPFRALRMVVRLFVRFCFLSSFIHPDFLLLSPKAPSPSPKTTSSTGPGPFALRVHQSPRGPSVAPHIGGACCAPTANTAATVDGAFNMQILHTLLACCPHAELTTKTYLRIKRLRLSPHIHFTRGIEKTQQESPRNPSKEKGVFHSTHGT